MVGVPASPLFQYVTLFPNILSTSPCRSGILLDPADARLESRLRVHRSIECLPEGSSVASGSMGAGALANSGVPHAGEISARCKKIDDAPPCSLS